MAFPSRRAVAAKEYAARPKALGTGMCRVFTEGRGTTTLLIVLGITSVANTLSKAKYGEAMSRLNELLSGPEASDVAHKTWIATFNAI